MFTIFVQPKNKKKRTNLNVLVENNVLGIMKKKIITMR